MMIGTHVLETLEIAALWVTHLSRNKSFPAAKEVFVSPTRDVMVLLNLDKS